jgi:hypothetical protein
MPAARFLPGARTDDYGNPPTEPVTLERRDEKAIAYLVVPTGARGSARFMLPEDSRWRSLSAERDDRSQVFPARTSCVLQLAVRSTTAKPRRPPDESHIFGSGWIRQPSARSPGHLALFLDSVERSRLSHVFAAAYDERSAVRLTVRPLQDDPTEVRVQIETLLNRQRAPLKQLRLAIRTEARTLAFNVARRLSTLFPPLAAPGDWTHSELHRAARELVAGLGDQAADHGWSAGRLKRRIRVALELLLNARAGGLGSPHRSWENDDDDDDHRPGQTILVPEALPADLVAAGADPLRDPRTKHLYTIELSSELRGRIRGDEAAIERLRNTGALIDRFIACKWLNYGPIAASLARAPLALEAVQFEDALLRKPANVLDGSFFETSWSYCVSKQGRRAWLLLLIRLGQQVLLRSATTLLLLVALVLLNVRHPVLWSLGWFLFADRLRELLLGPKTPTELQRHADLLKRLRAAETALWGDYVPVSLYRHALVTSTLDGAVWPEEAWRLLAHAERRGDTIWRIRPRYY